jgi:hypothetical protein
LGNSEVDNILEDIKKSGLPCEIEATALLQSYGWIVLNQSAYLDEDTGKLRHVDLIAYKYVNNYAIISLVIECSKSEKPWAFYGDLSNDNSIVVYPSYFPMQALAIAEQTHQANKEIFRGIIPYQPFKNGQSVDILDASMKAIKALEYRAAKKEKWEQDLERNLPHIFYPVIILDGHFYSLSLLSGKILAKKEEYMTYQFEYRTRYHLIDVINRQYLTRFCDLLENEIKGIEIIFDKYRQKG